MSYILHDGNLIYGYGSTEEAAEQEAERCLAQAGLTLTGLGVTYTTPASAALVEAVQKIGGDLSWRIHDGSGIAVTSDEYDNGAYGL